MCLYVANLTYRRRIRTLASDHTGIVGTESPLPPQTSEELGALGVDQLRSRATDSLALTP